MDFNNQYGTYERQCFLLDMMQGLHDHCLANDIKYSLSGGSALGAIRHKGFIPWDDDIDIILNRENFNKLVLTIKNDKRFEIIQDSWVPRIIDRNNADKEIYIDLFIVDNVPENRLVRKIKIFSLKILQGMMKEKTEFKKYKFFERFLVFGTYCIGKAFTFKCKKRMYAAVSQLGNNNKTDFINEYNSLYKYLPHRYPVSMIDNYILMPFENTEFFVMKGYDDYLSIHYGKDYMIPPSEKERIPQHM